MSRQTLGAQRIRAAQAVFLGKRRKHIVFIFVSMDLGRPVHFPIVSISLGIEARDGLAPIFEIIGNIDVKAAGVLAEILRSCAVKIIFSSLANDERITDVDRFFFHMSHSPRSTEFAFIVAQLHPRVKQIWKHKAFLT